MKCRGMSIKEKISEDCHFQFLLFWVSLNTSQYMQLLYYIIITVLNLHNAIYGKGRQYKCYENLHSIGSCVII